MLTETGISFATWLGSKIADKGFDAISEKLIAKNEIDAKFKQCVEFVAIRKIIIEELKITDKQILSL